MRPFPYISQLTLSRPLHFLRSYRPHQVIPRAIRSIAEQSPLTCEDLKTGFSFKVPGSAQSLFFSSRSVIEPSVLANKQKNNPQHFFFFSQDEREKRRKITPGSSVRIRISIFLRNLSSAYKLHALFLLCRQGKYIRVKIIGLFCLVMNRMSHLLMQ